MNPATATSSARPAQPIRLHGLRLSGHSHRVELFLSLLGLPYEFVEVNFMAGEHKSPEFLATKNFFGQIPVIQDGDVTLADSNAIMVYLCKRYGAEGWLPETPREAGEVQRWLSVAAGQLAYGAAAARLVVLFGATFQPEEVIGRAHGLFKVLEQVLGRTPFLTGQTPTIADVALYSYNLTAPEGNVSLADYPAVRAWLARIEALPGFLAMPRSAVGLAA